VAGLLLVALLVGSIDRLLHSMPAAGTQRHCGQQQLRALSWLQPREPAGYRLVVNVSSSWMISGKWFSIAETNVSIV